MTSERITSLLLEDDFDLSMKDAVLSGDSSVPTSVLVSMEAGEKVFREDVEGLWFWERALAQGRLIQNRQKTSVFVDLREVAGAVDEGRELLKLLLPDIDPARVVAFTASASTVMLRKLKFMESAEADAFEFSDKQDLLGATHRNIATEVTGFTYTIPDMGGQRLHSFGYWKNLGTTYVEGSAFWESITWGEFARLVHRNVGDVVLGFYRRSTQGDTTQGIVVDDERFDELYSLLQPGHTPEERLELFTASAMPNDVYALRRSLQ